MKPTKGAKKIQYDYGARNRRLLGHLVIIGYQTTAQDDLANIRVHPVFQKEYPRLIPGNWFQHEIQVSETREDWKDVHLTAEGYGFAPPEGPKMDASEVGEASIWRGKIYTFPASKTDEMREFLRNLFA
jgi:hypothetical protein